MTFTLTEVLLVLIAGTLMVVAGLLIWLAVRVSQVSGKMEEVLADVHKTVGRIDGIAEIVTAGAALVRQALVPSLTGFGALISGVKRGFRVLLGRGASHHGNGAMVHEEK